jgi:AbiV family abortive infection protein
VCLIFEGKMGRARRHSVNLTVTQAAEGIAAARRTASGLLSDAKLLLESERWQRATALAVLAIEEAGKVEILRSILLARNETELDAEWQAYRSHTRKNVSWIFLKLAEMGARTLDDFRSIFDKGSDHGKFIDTVKQECFYSNIADDGSWFSPDERISSSIAKSIFTVASVLVGEGPAPMTSAAELELWVKYLRPVWKGSMADMKNALITCYAEAEATGVLQGTSTAAAMLDFLHDDSTSSQTQ